MLATNLLGVLVAWGVKNLVILNCWNEKLKNEEIKRHEKEIRMLKLQIQN